MNDCTARLSGDDLTLSTGVVECRYLWNQGHLVSRSIRDLGGRVAWEFAGRAPDVGFPGQTDEPGDGELELLETPATPVTPAHLRVVVRTQLGRLLIQRVFRLYPGCPAMACDLYLRGRPDADWITTAADVAALASIENDAAVREGRPAATVLHRITLPPAHLNVECVRFFDSTDRRNNLVSARSVQPYRHPLALAGNLLLVKDQLADRSLFLLKEAPCSDMSLAWPGFDFVVSQGECQLVGVGLTPADLGDDGWTRGYGFALGIAPRDETALLSALRRYQDNLRLRQTERDDMILMNTWGDRGMAKGMSEAYVMEEIRGAARLGTTHLQLDHGWESTHDPSYGSPLKLDGIWDKPGFWEAHPQRFPRGLAPCVQAAREAGIELCLWFNPSIDDEFAHWSDDAGVLIDLYRRHGIRTFKVDGVELPTVRAELNFRRMLDAVQQAAGGQVVFNLDITAGRRGGYHYLGEYGNKFLENRYTDWSNYYPHWTLRNLWQLSRYVPPQSLQIEFLNPWRNADRYPPGDPLAPRNVPFAYCFAITMMAQPLAWMESRNLPSEAYALGDTIRVYRRYMQDIHAACILPIGEEPSGVGWTGFQAIGADQGYILVFRECNERSSAHIRLHGLAGQRLRGELCLGQGKSFTAQVDPHGMLEFNLPQPFGYALYRYRRQPGRPEERTR